MREDGDTIEDSISPFNAYATARVNHNARTSPLPTILENRK